MPQRHTEEHSGPAVGISSLQKDNFGLAACLLAITFVVLYRLISRPISYRRIGGISDRSIASKATSRGRKVQDESEAALAASAGACRRARTRPGDRQ